VTAGRWVAAAAVVLGVSAEWVAYRGAGVGTWGPDLAVGWGLVACGLALRRRLPGSRCGALLCAAGLVWFAGNFAAVDAAVVAWLAEHGAYVHRACLAHAVLAFPRGRIGPLARRAVVVTVYAASLWPPLATSDTAWIVLAVAVLAASLAVGDRRAVPGAAAFAVAVGAVAAARTFLEPVDWETLLHLYEAGLLATGLVLLVTAPPSAATVADRVVELGETASVRDALRRVLGEPSLELAFARDGSYIDERGMPIASPFPPQYCVTALGPSGDAVVVHDPAVVVDGALADAVSRALRLTTENERLQADVLEQLAELRASRRRLVLARGRQRALLARRLREGAEARLAGIEAALAGIETGDGAAADAVERARRQAREACEAIDALARGLLPRMLARDGLAAALHALAESSTVPVSVTVDERRLDAAVEHAAYLVCSEALANVAKHAAASKAEVRVTVRGGRLRLEIADDGRGGADPAGTGLRGLAERVEELGGTLGIRSPRGAGTRLTAEIPLRTDRDLPSGVEEAPTRPAPATVGTAS
jgi:signal transduction histidine kinase